MRSILNFRSQQVSFTIYLASILAIIYLPVNLNVLLLVFLLNILLCSKIDRNFLIYAPFVIFPFSSLLRAGDANNYLVALLPEFMAILFIASYVFHSGGTHYHSYFSLSLIIFAFASTFVHLAHTGEFYFFFIIVRTFFFPVLFLITAVNFFQLKNYLLADIFGKCIISFSIICAIVLLNISQILTVNPSTPFLYPFVRYEYFLETGNADLLLSRTLLGFSLPRIRTFLGGANGSSAAVLMAFGLICLKRILTHNFLYNCFLTALFFITAVATLSTSIIIPIVLFYIIFAVRRKIGLILLPVILTFFFLVAVTEISSFGSVGSYFLNSIWYSLTETLMQQEFSNVLLNT